MFTTSRLDEFVREVHAWPRLDAAGLPRRRSLLLFGPPGCGKTSIASSLAHELNRPFVTVKTESVVSSYLGETATNLSQIFEFARLHSVVLLLDEFDSLGKVRDDPTDHGELRRVVNAVLQLIDRYAGPSIIVAATNHEDVLDTALWRRFSEVLEVPMPTLDMRIDVLSRCFLGRIDHDVDIQGAAIALEDLPHAACEAVAYDALRLAVLDGRRTANRIDVEEAVHRNTQRRWM